jgi:hypothetical protein
VYPPEMFFALERRKLLPISVNVSDATRSDMATAERQAAVWCVIASQDVSEDRRRELAKSYATDSDATIQRLAITGVRWDSESVDFLRSLKCASGNEFYLLRAIASSGDSSVLRQCVELFESGEEHSQIEASMIAADLGNPDAVELLRLMFESSSSEYVRMFIAFNLIRSNDHGCLDYLEAKLDEVGTETRALFVGALAVARSHRGIQAAQTILHKGDEQERLILRQCLFTFGVSAAKEADWIIRTSEWLVNVGVG